MSIPFHLVFRAAAFGGGRLGRSSDSVYFRVKFSPGRFAISRRIVQRGQYNHGDGIPTRVGIPELSSVRARLVGPTCFRRNFRKSNSDAGAACNTVCDDPDFIVPRVKWRTMVTVAVTLTFT